MNHPTHPNKKDTSNPLTTTALVTSGLLTFEVMLELLQKQCATNSHNHYSTILFGLSSICAFTVAMSNNQQLPNEFTIATLDIATVSLFIMGMILYHHYPVVPANPAQTDVVVEVEVKAEEAEGTEAGEAVLA